MNLDSLVKLGCTPWLPNAEAETLDVWHADDVPTAGTFSYADRTWLFSAVVDVEDRTTVWGYVALTPPELDRVEGLQSVQEMQSFIDDVFAQQREIVLAGADEFVIESWGRREGDESLLAAATAFIKEWVKTLRDAASEREQFNAFRAGADEYHKSNELAAV